MPPPASVFRSAVGVVARTLREDSSLEGIFGELRLTQDRSKGAVRYFLAMHRDDDHRAPLPKLRMASFLGNIQKTMSLQDLHNVTRGK